MHIFSLSFFSLFHPRMHLAKFTNFPFFSCLFLPFLDIGGRANIRPTLKVVMRGGAHSEEEEEAEERAHKSSISFSRKRLKTWTEFGGKKMGQKGKKITRNRGGKSSTFGKYPA